MTMTTDPIADLLTRIRNAIQAKHEVVSIPASKEKVEISRILKEEGFIRDYHVDGDGPTRAITVVLKYGPNGEKVITGLRRISKPGMRVYAKVDSIPRVLNGLGIAIISTSEGVVTDKQARQKHVGGEVLAYVW
ncbi:30S ribosomal protein S8 [Erysipelothrix larvae]|uniref:Small ribosomal subunit protein uS8 n=1 Tax=Erysipelothrix larvae TaxID=1514105 RepID=A0A0X8H025_9FIRM|nr:30S ribosomal protein S8 [Erysipelothrix larvae]